MTLLIRNVQILGARQKYDGPQDVFVSGSRISAIGSFPRKAADEVIDGKGMYLSPGFIDIHTESDHFLSLLDVPMQEDFLRQGVTTIIGGHDGVSLAPLLYGDLESVSPWTHPQRVNIDWHTVKEYLSALQRRQLGVNFGTLAGYDTIRRALTGGVMRKLTGRELTVFHGVLDRARKEGAFGISFGIDDLNHGVTGAKERDMLLSGFSGSRSAHSFSLGAHTPEYETIVEGIMKEMKDVPGATLLSHIPSDRIQGTLDLLMMHPRAYATITPSHIKTFPITFFLPSWGRKHTLTETLAGIREEWLREKMKKEMLPIDPNRIAFVSAPHHKTLVGMTLREFMEMMQVKDANEAFLLAMEAMHGMGAVSYAEKNPVDFAAWVSHPRTLVSSQSASIRDHHAHSAMPLTEGRTAFTDVLAFIEKEDVISLDEAIQKMTSLPAALFSITNRGVIAPGAYADLIGFSGSEIDFVIVNGRVALQEGIVKEVRAGSTLRNAL